MDTLDLSVERRRGFRLYRKTDEDDFFELSDVTQLELNMIVDSIQRGVDQHSSMGLGDLFITPRNSENVYVVLEEHEYFTWREIQLRRNKMWEF